MHFINIYFLSFTNRKFLLKTNWSLMMVLSMFFYKLEASSLTPKPVRQQDYQIQSDAEAFVHEWLYNYYEKPTRPEIEMATKKLTKMLDTFQHRKSLYSTEEEWLKDIFYQVHEKYLKCYKSYSTVPDLFEQGNYDCVSGTALYALICELLYIPYVIRETEYHVYLLALVDGKKVLIESTDPVYGFVSQADTVQRLMKEYQEEGSSRHGIHEATNSTVDWIQLAGLQYFNKAVLFYNRKNFQDALFYLNKAMQYYMSDRITSFKKSILQIRATYPKTQVLKSK